MQKAEILENDNPVELKPHEPNAFVDTQKTSIQHAQEVARKKNTKQNLWKTKKFLSLWYRRLKNPVTGKGCE